MNNKYKGKPCAYCVVTPAVTGDHIFARKFFLEHRRADLPQVPVCDKCNREKAKLEHYLTAILPFGGQHSDALTNLETMVPKRLAKNVKLHTALANSQQLVWNIAPSGLILPTISVSIDSNQIAQLFSFIVRGLTWYHWQTYLSPDEPVKVRFITEAQSQKMDAVFALGNSEQRSNNLGDGTAVYRVTRSIANPELSLWEFSLYGGLQLAGEDIELGNELCKVIAVTGNDKNFSELFKALFQ